MTTHKTKLVWMKVALGTLGMVVSTAYGWLGYRAQAYRWAGWVEQVTA